jgi:hypothetical protein
LYVLVHVTQLMAFQMIIITVTAAREERNGPKQREWALRSVVGMWHWQRTKHADAVPSWKRLMT